MSQRAEMEDPQKIGIEEAETVAIDDADTDLYLSPLSAST
jgi:hypothetical protein